ncbi:MAG: 2-oxoacid:acceptor oxidoreductase family protein, partial [Acetobacteraceae bacterium]|nr:2-oxoacid:acceptor oxidoreductase family protein [Acetobacteraceae bacterium]
PVETPLGRKRRINPTSCNVDLSCLKGFCPSFVTADGPPRTTTPNQTWLASETELGSRLAEPQIRNDLSWRALFAGIGGGGIVTTSAIVAMAAQLDGLQVSTLNFTGLAQKNGAVVSHVQIGEPGQLDVVRIPLGTADLVFAADLAIACSRDVLDRCRPGGAVIGNLDLAATAAFKYDPWLKIDAGLHRRTIERATDPGRSLYLHAAIIAERLFGDAQVMNTMLLGLAWQRGLVPVSRNSLMRAIELNGASVPVNRRAFEWGRILAANPDLIERMVEDTSARHMPADLNALIEDRCGRLVLYQDRAYADLYRNRVNRIVACETGLFGRPGRLSRAAAEGWFRVMAPKDEYEVARLHASADYSGTRRPVFHLAPPLLSGRDAATGRRRKRAIPGWLALPLFRLLRHGKLLRGTPLDPFALQDDRRAERAMLKAYAEDMDAVLAVLDPDKLDAAIALAEVPDKVRGFGPVKLENWRRAQDKRQALLRSFQEKAPKLPIAAE